MTDGEAFDLGDAYAVETPDDNRELYRKWADTYESGYMTSRGYVYHENVARVFLESSPSGPVLDVGCGTGVVGEVLVEAGLGPIDGVDISPEMLDKAADKKTSSGAATYRNLIEADLTGTIDIADDTYASIISVGTFTFGHLPADSLSELFRVAVPGAVLGIGVNAKHFAETGFAPWLDEQVSRGVIGDYDLVEIAMYDGGDGDHSADEHADDKAHVLRLTMP